MSFRRLSTTLVMVLILSGCSLGESTLVDSADNDSESASTGKAGISAPAGAASTGDYQPVYSNSFDSQWSTEVSREEMIETALYKLFRDLDEIRVDDCQITSELFMADPLLPEHEYLIEEITDGMIESFCIYMTEDIPVIAGSYDFVKEVIAEQGYPSDEFGGNCGFDLQQDYASACAAFGVTWTGISLGSKRDGKPYIEERRLTIAAHELFHTVHGQINPNSSPGIGECRSYACQGPVWFFEGAGEFFGRAMTQYLGLQNYDTFVPTDRNGYYIDGEYLSDLDFLTERRNLAGSVENYYSGQIAMEMLIANVGLLPVLQVWEKLEEGQIFPDAFRESIGIELEDFYEKFRTLHLRLYEEGGYCQSTLGCPEWQKSDQEIDWFGDYQRNQTGDSGKPSADPNEVGIRQDCLELNSQWWSKCTELELQIPDQPENSDHGFSTEYESIPKITSCDELADEGFGNRGWAKDFRSRDSIGADQANVSTQIYAALRHLDLNSDGVLCSSQIPD